MTIVSPSGREYQWGKETPPSNEDFAQLKAYDESLGGKPEQVVGQGDQGQPELSAGQVVGGTALELGMGITGGLVGSLAGPVGTVVGAATMGAVGNYLNQKLFQDKDDVSAGQVLASAAMAAVPAGAVTKALKAATSVGRAAAITSAQGAGTALLGTAIEKGVDEGRFLTAEEAGMATAGGALFGAALGGLGKRYELRGGLITNPLLAQGTQMATGIGVTAYAYNQAVERGDENPIPKAMAYGALAYGGTHIPSLIAKMGTGNVLRKVGGPEPVLGKAMGPIREAEIAFKAMEAESYDAAKTVKDFAMKEANPSQVVADLLAVQDGKQSIDTLPESVKVAYKSFAEKRAKFSDEILDKYGHILDDDTKEAIKKGRESYIRTTYAAHDPRARIGVDFATKESADKFKAELIGRGMTDQDATATMNKMLNGVTDIFGSESFIKGTGPSSAFKKKGDLSQAARDYLGEVRDPFARIENTLTAQNRLIINEVRDVSLREILTTGGIAKTTLTPEELASGIYVKMVKGNEPTVHNTLADLYVPSYVADAFREAISPNLIGDGAIAKSFMTINGLSKASKTIGNLPEAIMPQVFGNLLIAASSFKLNPIEIVRGIRMTMYGYGWTGKNLSVGARLDMNAKLNEARKFGILRGGADSAELNTLISQSADIGRKPKAILEQLSKAYGFPDSAVRYSIWQQNIKELKEINWLATQPSGTGLDALKKHAAQITNDQFPTYELIPRRFRQASALGVANTFGAFEYEVIRNSANQLKYASSLIAEGQRTGNAEMRLAGAKRLLSLAAVAGTTTGISVAISRSNGVSDEKQKALKNIMPVNDSEKANAFNLNKDGTFSYTPLNYIMPHANMTSAFVAGYKGEDSGAILKSMLLGQDIGPLLTPAIEGITNVYYNTNIPIDEPRNNASLALRSGINAFMPQVISGTISRAYKANAGQTNKLGNSPTGEDVALRLAGFRQNTINTIAAASVRIRGVSDGIADESKGYRRIIKSADQSNRPIDEPTIYAERSVRYEQKQKELGRMYSDLMLLSEDGGFTESQIIGAFKQAGVPNRLIAAAKFNYIVPMSRGIEPSNSEIIQEIMDDPIASKNIGQSIKARAAGNQLVERNLFEAYRTESRNIARGVDPISKIFSGLSIGDGERAQAIARAAGTMKDDPEGLKKMIDHFRRTRVITPDVEMQLRNARP